MSHWLTIGALVIASLTIFGCNGEENVPANTTTPETAPPPEPIVIELELYPQKAPKTVERIAGFIEDGFYDGQRFHRVIDGATQWGSPLSRTTDLRDERVGAGSSDQPLLPFETNDVPMEVGTLAMASTGAKVGGDCQMFIVNSRAPEGLTQSWSGNYAAFGKVTSNMEGVDRVRVGDYIEMRVVEKTADLVRVELVVTSPQ